MVATCSHVIPTLPLHVRRLPWSCRVYCICNAVVNTQWSVVASDINLLQDTGLFHRDRRGRDKDGHTLMGGFVMVVHYATGGYTMLL
jgi:hypothetical protein